MQCQQGESQPQTPGPSCSLTAPLIGACSLPCNWTQAPGVSQQPPLPPSFSVTHPLQGKINTPAHSRRRTERSISWERGWKQMLLACLITAAHPWVSASWLAVGNGTCFPSLCPAVLAHRQWETRRVELHSRVKLRCIRTPATRCRSGVPACASITHPGVDALCPFPLCVPPEAPIPLQSWGSLEPPAVPGSAKPGTVGRAPEAFPPSALVGCGAWIAHAREESSHTETHQLLVPAHHHHCPHPPMPPMAGGGPPGLSLPSQGLPTGILP